MDEETIIFALKVIMIIQLALALIEGFRKEYIKSIYLLLQMIVIGFVIIITILEGVIA